MRKPLLIFGLVLLSSCVTTGQDGKLNKLTARVQLLELKNKELEKEVEKLRKENLGLRQELPKLKVTVNSLGQKIEEVRRELKPVELKTASLIKRQERESSLKLAKLKRELLEKVNSIREELRSLKECCKGLGSSVGELEEKVKELSGKVEELSQRLNSLKIPSVKVEEVKPASGKK